MYTCIEYSESTVDVACLDEIFAGTVEYLAAIAPPVDGFTGPAFCTRQSRLTSHRQQRTVARRVQTYIYGGLAEYRFGHKVKTLSNIQYDTAIR